MYHVIARSNGQYITITSNPVDIHEARIIQQELNDNHSKIVNEFDVEKAIKLNNNLED